MNPILNATRVEITSNECAAFVSRAVNNPFNTSGIVTGAVAGSKAEVKGDLYTTLDADLLTRPDRKLDVVSFVRQTYIHGTPMDLAAGFEGARNEQILVEMLEDSRESDHWGNIVAVLGMIGGADAVPHVITWLEMHGQSKPEWSSVREITAGNMALGYLANRTGSRDAIAYLVKTARTSGRANDPELDDALADAGAIGLALAGTENSLQLIEMIYDRYVSLDPKTTRAPLEHLVEINLEIQKYGLDGAYAR